MAETVGAPESGQVRLYVGHNHTQWGLALPGGETILPAAVFQSKPPDEKGVEASRFLFGAARVLAPSCPYQRQKEIRPFNWVRAYQEGLYAQSEENHKKAERVGEPREPEMRLVLEGELTEAPAGATVRPPVQHSTAGPYQLPLSLLQQGLQRCLLGQP